jgi:hypothetical protein
MNSYKRNNFQTFGGGGGGNRLTEDEWEEPSLLLSQKASFMARFRRRCFSTQVTGFGSKSTTDA